MNIANYILLITTETEERILQNKKCRTEFNKFGAKDRYLEGVYDTADSRNRLIECDIDSITLEEKDKLLDVLQKRHIAECDWVSMCNRKLYLNPKIPMPVDIWSLGVYNRYNSQKSDSDQNNQENECDDNPADAEDDIIEEQSSENVVDDPYNVFKDCVVLKELKKNIRKLCIKDMTLVPNSVRSGKLIQYSNEWFVFYAYFIEKDWFRTRSKNKNDFLQLMKYWFKNDMPATIPSVPKDFRDIKGYFKKNNCSQWKKNVWKSLSSNDAKKEKIEEYIMIRNEIQKELNDPKYKKNEKTKK